MYTHTWGPFVLLDSSYGLNGFGQHRVRELSRDADDPDAPIGRIGTLEHKDLWGQSPLDAFLDIFAPFVGADFPHIERVWNVGTCDDGVYYHVDLQPSLSLTALGGWLDERGGRLSTEELAAIGLELCGVLQQAHAILRQHGTPQGLCFGQLGPYFLHLRFDGSLFIRDLPLLLWVDSQENPSARRPSPRFPRRWPVTSAQMRLNEGTDWRRDLYVLAWLLARLGLQQMYGEIGRLRSGRLNGAEEALLMEQEPWLGHLLFSSPWNLLRNVDEQVASLVGLAEAFSAELRARDVDAGDVLRDLFERVTTDVPVPDKDVFAVSDWSYDPFLSIDGAERTAELRYLLMEPATRWTAIGLRKLLSFWPEDEDRLFALDYALQHAHDSQQQAPPLTLRPSHALASVKEQGSDALCAVERLPFRKLFTSRLKRTPNDEGEVEIGPDAEYVTAFSLHFLLAQEDSFARFSRSLFAAAVALSIGRIVAAPEDVERDVLFGALLRLEDIFIDREGALLISGRRFGVDNATAISSDFGPLAAWCEGVPMASLDEVLVLGISLYHLLTGQRPFSSLGQALDAGERLPPPPMDAVPTVLRGPLAKMLLPNPLERPPLLTCLLHLEDFLEASEIDDVGRFLSGWLYHTQPVSLLLEHYNFLIYRSGRLEPLE